MDRKRKVYAPFSQTSEAGVTQTPVEGYIDVNQTIYPTVNTGVVNEKGQWSGVKSNDTEFIGLSRAESVANGAAVLFPDTSNISSINMAGFTGLQIAIKTTQGGTYNLKAVFGPDVLPYGNLNPIMSGDDIKIVDSIGSADENILSDNITISYSNQWFVLTILKDRFKEQLNAQIKVTNSTGSASNIDFAFRRLV